MNGYKKVFIFILLTVMFMQYCVCTQADGKDMRIDFETGLNGFQSTYFVSIEDVGGEHNNVMKIQADPEKKEAALFSGKNFNMSNSKTLISFDVMINVLGSKMTILLRTSEGKVIGRLYFETDGKMYATNDSVKSESIAYTSKRWYSIDVVMNFDELVYEWLLDGRVFYSESMAATTTADSSFGWFYVGVTQDNSVGEMYLDNVSVVDYNAREYLDIDPDSIVLGENSVTAEFSEKIDNESVNMTDRLRLVDTLTGVEVDTEEIVINARKISIVLNEPLKTDVEYALCGVDGLKSITGKSFKGDIIYLMKESGGNAAPSIGESIARLNFENGELESENITFLSNLADCEIVDYDGQKVLRYTASGNSNGENTTISFTLNGDDKEQTRMIISYDVMLLQENVFSFLSKIYDTDGNMIYNAIFNAKNKFMSFHKKNLNPDYNTAMNSESSRSAVTAGIEKNRWYRITLKFDRNDLSDSYFGKTSIWLDNTEVGNYSTAAGAFCGTIGRLVFEDYGERTSEINGKSVRWGSEPGAAILIDNIQAGYPQSTSCIKKIRLENRDGTLLGPLSDRVLATAQRAYIYFNVPIKTSTVNSDTLKFVSENGTECGFSIEDYDSGENKLTIRFDEFLQKNQRYSLIADGICSSTDDLTIATYTTSFKTTEEAEFYAENICLKDNTNQVITALDDVGGDVSLCMDVFNSTDDDKLLYGILTRINDYAMTDCRLKTIRIPANQSITIDTDIVLSADTWRNSQIYGYVCDESFVPLYNLSVGKTQEFLWDDYSVSVSATKVYDGDVMIIVTQEGKELSDIKDSEDIIWAGKINGNETADVKLKMNAELASGCYNAYFISEGQDELMPIYYINKTSANNVIAQIKDAALRADTAEINELLIDNKKDLQIEISYSDNMDFTMASKIIASYIGDNGDFGGNLLEAVKIINGATVAEAASGGYIADLFKYSDKIGIASGRLSELYQKNFVTDVFKQNVTARLKGKRFETFAEFDSAIYEAFVLQTVKMPDGIDNLKAVIDEFYREIGLSTSNCSNAVLREVTNREFYSYADLKTALNNAENSAPSASGGSIGGVTYSASVKATDSVNKPILKDIYSDLGEAKWASDAIIKLTEMGIVKGKGNDEFKPNDFITREEFVTMVVNAFASDENIAEITFSDVKETDWFYGCVSRGFGARLIRGISEEEFGVGRDIIRQDMAVIIKRSADYYGIILDETAVREPLSDFEAISDYAKDEVQILYCNGIVNGVGDAFEPFERATRAQAALLIYTLLMSI